MICIDNTKSIDSIANDLFFRLLDRSVMLQPLRLSWFRTWL